MQQATTKRLRLRKAVPLNLTADELALLDERANAAGLSRHAYMIASLMLGSLQAASEPQQLQPHLPLNYVRKPIDT